MKKLTSGVTVLNLLLSISLIAAEDWIQIGIGTHPNGRASHGMAFISEGKVLLFGGYDLTGNSYNDETWIFDINLNQWTQLFPQKSPPAQAWHEMDYIGDDKVLLYGNGFWVYDFSENNWEQISPISTVMPDRTASMAYIGDDKVLFFGGYKKNWALLYDFSENTLQRMYAANPPSERNVAAMSYIGDDKVLMFGGFREWLAGEDGVGEHPNDAAAYIYDLSDNAWTKIEPAIKPPPRCLHKIAYMGEDKVMIFGGCPNQHFINPINDTWVFDLSDKLWIQDMNSVTPSAREMYGMAETSRDGSTNIVMFGGVFRFYTWDDGCEQTWTFGGGDFMAGKYYHLTLDVFPLNGGILDPLPGSYQYLENTEVNLSARSSSGYIFDYWGGDIENSELEEITISVVSDLNVVAYFQTPSEASASLIEYITNMDVHQGVASSLIRKLEKFNEFYERGRLIPAVNILNALINQIEALQGEKIAMEDADYLIAQIEKILKCINGGLEKKSASKMDESPENDQISVVNFPNPFNNATTLVYSLNQESYVDISIFSIDGKLIINLLQGYVGQGIHRIIWSGKNRNGNEVPTGTYLFIFKYDEGVRTRKINLIK